MGVCAAESRSLEKQACTARRTAAARRGSSSSPGSTSLHCTTRPKMPGPDGAGSRRTVSKPRDTVPTNLSRETALAPAHTMAAAAMSAADDETRWDVGVRGNPAMEARRCKVEGEGGGRGVREMAMGDG